MIDLAKLNDNQKDAVLSDDQYIRIVAGAGSGKTRVLTMRIVHLIQDLGVFPSKVLAITFTNKAANEMKNRIQEMLKEETSTPWISTIHSLCVRILREDIMSLGFPRNFTIWDGDDQKTIIMDAYKELNLDSVVYPYAAMLDYISNNKGANISVERAFELAGSFSADKTKAEVYAYYVRQQNSLYALDFDDLIIQTVKMFKKHTEILEKWSRRFAYIHVDEFQDIDAIQYELITLLAAKDNSLYVVGDPDQTIYTWRGADVNIIMNFVKEYPSAKTIILNENYRSTDAILNGANSVIQNNHNRVKKELFTQKKSNVKITHYASPTDLYQAAWIARKVQELHSRGMQYHDIAILYRSNYLSRPLEKAFIEERIPYIIYGGVRFYERMEVKDALCYLRMVTHGDDLALRRIINKPKRGIGNKTMDTLIARAREKNLSIYELLKEEIPVSGKAQKTLAAFVEKVESWRKLAQGGEMEVFALFEHIMQDSGYQAMLEEEQELDRIENIKELIDDVKEFSETNPDSDLDEYLQMVSLYGDREETMSSDFIQLMTVHAAKGLEFDTVFVTDMNEGIFPNERSMNEGLQKGIEEERRLAYVAFTRAENKLFLTEAGGFSYILQRQRTTSRFIKEIDEAYIEHMGVSQEVEKGMYHSSFHEEVRTPSFSERLRSAANISFNKGEAVVHDKFGEGVVLSCADGFVEVAFSHPYGVKRIMAGHPTLHKKSEMN